MCLLLEYNRMRDDTVLSPYFALRLILLYILVYKNVSLSPPSSLLQLSFSAPLLSYFPFLALCVKNFACVT